MNEYSIKDIYSGLKHSFSVQITEEMISAFGNLTGDTNPLHINKNYALAKGFKDKVVYGMLSSSFFSTLVGMHIPGKHALFQSINVSFVSPVYVGDILTISGEVIAVNSSLGQIEIRGLIINQLGTKVSWAKIRSGINE